MRRKERIKENKRGENKEYYRKEIKLEEKKEGKSK